MTDKDKIKLMRMLISEFLSYVSDDTTAARAVSQLKIVDAILGCDGDEDEADWPNCGERKEAPDVKDQ